MKNRFHFLKFVLVTVVSLAFVSFTYLKFYVLKDTSKEVLLKAFNYSISTQTVGPKYQFTKETSLVETAQQIQAMGSNLLKFSMHPRYCTENYGLPENKDINSLTKLATLESSFSRVLNMDFKYYHIWVYGFSQYTPEPAGVKDDTAQIKFINGYPKVYEQALYDELYEFTSYLLKEFNNTGKVFYLGNWEGDWHLRPDYNRHNKVNPKTLKGMTRWAKIRQKAIDDAKKNHPQSDVEVYHYIEVNLVRKAINEPKSKVVVNTIVKDVNPDYVSYSSYDATNPFKTEEAMNKNLHEALDFIESHLSPKDNLPQGKRVWIGEYGNPSNRFDDQSQNQRSIWTIKSALNWGTPYILYWEMYNNEIKSETNEQVGYWLITDKGVKQPIWHTHHNFYKESQAFVDDYINQNGELPNFDTFRKAAVSFNSLNP